ncbi:MAG: phosphoenolpyruvate carboxykinase (GTP) [Candidatus Omnitrophica bacterium]|nr:phosphoenolpyruvate carboxykinase (GTP) [Candidatus Omnitrophota bacterium]
MTNNELLKEKCNPASYEKLMALRNTKLHEFVASYAELCNPNSIYVGTDAKEDRAYIRQQALKNGEEKSLAIKGHTIHFDGAQDQARDKAQTKYLLPHGADLTSVPNAIEKGPGIEEIRSILKDIMVGKEMYVLFFCLGPTGSEFSIPCVQLTDSSYVGHSEYILCRTGYEQFKEIGSSEAFFRYVHSAGDLENGVSKNVDKRRVYIDIEEDIVYSTNTQYAGNTVGLKKLSLRLAIQKASREGWLAEHMFLMAVHGPKGRKTYFSGAFPSACGKTSTAMLPGETIIGDDIAYLRKYKDALHGVNVECGIFGIIQDVNDKDDPVIWKVLSTPGQAIFSNVLVCDDNHPRWLGDGRPAPEKGINFSGQWHKGKKDADGKEIPSAHKNARYTISLYDLSNTDSELDNPHGVPVRGIIYGGRDSSILPPVQEAFNWEHGIITMGASLESETTAATLGKEGVRQINPMSNLDFLSIYLGTYINNNLQIVKGIEKPPRIFLVNYFQKDKEGNYLTAMEDKRVWIKWMELRVHGDVDAIKLPTGSIPEYEDLKRLFKEVLNKEYTEEDYLKQFSIRVLENCAKIARIKEFYTKHKKNVPDILFTILDEQKKRLERAHEEHGDSLFPPAFRHSQ